MIRTVLRSVGAAAVIAVSSLAAMSQVVALDTARMDRSVSPCGDFYQFVNGEWLRSTQIPASEARWGTFNILAENNNQILKDVLEAASTARTRKGSDAQLIGDFYATCMDEAAIENAGTKPLDPIFRRINSMRTKADVQRVIAELHNNGIPAVFGFGAGPDLKDSNAVIVNAGQGGISLPNREYYDKKDAKSIETRRKFIEHMANMFKLLGDDEATAKANANTVMLMQTQLAAASQTPIELRNPDNRYNLVGLQGAQKTMPDFAWAAYMSARGIAPAKNLNLPGAKFFEEANAMMRDVPVSDWKTYFRWMTINSAAPTLSKAFRDENFEFFGRYLSGQQEQQPRWKTCVQAVNGNLGEALGMEYANRAFKPEAKARMNELIDNLMAAMKVRIDNLEWMSPATKAEAQKKLSTFKRKIGYPDVLRGYKGLTIDRSSYAANVQRSNKFQLRRNFDDLGKPRDKARWGFTPPTVNASYSPVNNEITFPAGILQPPFFNFDADDAINYGAIGGVIGHEITHGLDDQGSRFDAEGNLKMWWTAEDRAKFEERAACVVKQWDNYEVQPGLFMQGKLALGENIGDFAGLSVAYDAYMRSLEGKPRPADIDGFTPEQRFFLGWGQIWAGKYTPEAERRQVQTGPHSLPKWRVNGPLSNMPQFRQAFGCKQGDAMVRDNACSIW
ncbi:MAG: M13 family metallopeptidase [Pyrinomonadaceae bacterium]|nr:M13 family metallopeptidase [Pyrinomonadaceae bacterium]